MSANDPAATCRKGRILVIRGGAIGDFVVTLPVLSALRGRFPWAAVEVMGYAHIAVLASVGGLADAVWPIDSRALAGFFARGGELDPDLSGMFAGCDVIFSYLYDPDEIFRTNLLRVTGAQVVQGPHRPYDTSPMDAASQLLVPLERLGIFDADARPRLPVEARRDAGLLALHPGSGGAAKNWPADRWKELVRRLVAETSLRLMLVGGEAEGALLEELTASVPEGRIGMERNRPLDRLAALLAGCGGFVGHDSGITHLAAAVGTPCVALWGPSVERVWRPAGAHVMVLRHADGLAALEVGSVYEAATAVAR